jgi:DNA-directed RNA polymerase subunit RPC12/RpoP
MWFRNHYKCARCGSEWKDEWSATSDDDCPQCGARHMTPYESEDLTEIIDKRRDTIIVLRSSDKAEHQPNYEQIAEFLTEEQAEAYLKDITR